MGCRAEGGASGSAESADGSRANRAAAIGTVAAIAVSAASATMAWRWRRKTRQNGSSPRTTKAMCAPGAVPRSRIPDPRIEHAIEQIDHEIRDDDARADHQEHRHDHGVVVLEDRIEGQPPHPRPRE